MNDLELLMIFVCYITVI